MQPFGPVGAGKNVGQGTSWTPRLEPPHPKYLTSSTQSRHIFTRVLEAMESADTADCLNFDTTMHLSPNLPRHGLQLNYVSSGSFGLKPDLPATLRGPLVQPENSLQRPQVTCVTLTSASQSHVMGSLAEGASNFGSSPHSHSQDMYMHVSSHAQQRLHQDTPAHAPRSISPWQSKQNSNVTLNHSSGGTVTLNHSSGGTRRPVVKTRRSKDNQAAAHHCSLLKHLDSHPVRSSHKSDADKDGGRPLTTRKEENVEEMGREELEEVRRLLSEAEEVAMTLVHTDGTSQLRNTDKRRQQPSEGKSKPCSVCVAYPVKGQAGPVLRYANFPLVFSSDDKMHEVCSILTSLLSVSKVIAYKGQEIISALLSSFNDITPNVWINWCPLDMAVGAWLLDPDNVPDSFSELLARYGMQQLAPPPSPRAPPGEISALHHDLALLGPLMVKIYQQLQSKSLLSVFLEIETKLIPILAAMSVQGLKVNCTKLIQFGDTLKKKIARVEVSAHKAAGRNFQINSTSQLREILFDQLHLDENMKLSKTQVHHHKSTSEAVLTMLSPLHPLPKVVLEYRHLCKVNATYITGIMPHIQEGMLKPLWVHTGTATGRLVACNPNIQAFPKHVLKLGVVEEQYVVGKQPVEVEIDVREVIESREGFTFLAADFKSIELRVLAHLSEDVQLLSAFNLSQNADIFITLASEWLGVEQAQVTAAERERTKHVVYAVVYGVGKERLGEMIKVSPSVAKELTNSFLGRFPGVQRYINETVAECRLKGFLKTVCQRRRWFPQISSAQAQVKTHAERQAVNFPVQGSAADICKVAMITVVKMLAEDSPRTRLLVQIHDELLFEVPDDEMPSISGKIKQVLEKVKSLPCELKVPLQVRVSSGKTWSSLTPISILEQCK